MAYQAQTDPIRVPPDLWRYLRCAIPTVQGSMLAIAGAGGAPQTGAPHRYILAGGNVTDGTSAFSVAFTMALSATVGATHFPVVFDTMGQFVGAGLAGARFQVRSGVAQYLETTSAGANTTHAATISTVLGTTHRFCIVRDVNPQYAAIFQNGTLILSAATVQSWTQTATVALGSTSVLTGVYSHHLRDFYWFDTALTANQVLRLYETVR